MASHLKSALPQRRAIVSALLLAALSLLACGTARAENEGANTYDEDSILKAASDFLGDTTEGLGKVIAKAFKEQGRPSGYIKGEEIAGAITLGLRYGEGQLVFKQGGESKVFWQGPSIGFDLGANAAKVFVLIYHARTPGELYKRFPSVDGSLYYIGGAGINYQQREQIVLAPIRLGVGLRAGASIGYTHYTPEKSLNPL